MRIHSHITKPRHILQITIKVLKQKSRQKDLIVAF